MGFKPIFKNRSFFEPFLLLYRQKTKSAQGQQKERSNQKVEENEPALELNVLYKYKWAGLDFEVGYLTEPYWAVGK